MPRLRVGAVALAPLLALALALPAAASQSRSPAGHAARAAHPARRRLILGASDESAAMFQDPRFRWLGLTVARLVLPWDVLHDHRELARADQWLTAARSDGVAPLIVFDHSARHPGELPSVAKYAHQVLTVMRRYPWVRAYSPWDEENHEGEPTARNPARAAAYFTLLQRSCHRCLVTAADVLDEPNMTHWVRGFLAHVHVPTRVWGLHNYFDLNDGGHRGTSRLLSLVHGQIWFTETGGLVWRYDRKHRRFLVRGEASAARAAARLLALARLSPRITRIYYYHWRIAITLSYARKHHGYSWDSGLIRPDCTARPAFNVLARALGRIAVRAPRVVRGSGGLACVSATPSGPTGAAGATGSTGAKGSSGPPGSATPVF